VGARRGGVNKAKPPEKPDQTCQTIYIKMLIRIIVIMLTLCYNAVITVPDCTNFAKV